MLSLLKLHIIALWFLITSTFEIALVGGTLNILPERYELCKTDACVENLRQFYGLTAVSATPTKASMHPMWPETLTSIFTALVAVITSKNNIDLDFGDLNDLTTHSSSRYKFTRLTVVLTVVIGGTWIISFGFIQFEQSKGGWISVLDWLLTLTVAIWAAETSASSTWAYYFLFATIQFVGSVAAVAQGWAGEVGSVAYIISDSHGCNPLNGFEYLERGARAFRIIQTTELAYSITIGVVVACPCLRKIVRDTRARSDRAVAANASQVLRIGIMLLLILVDIPVLVYESVIATTGRPIVISGDCMLVELDPRLGFLDSSIEAWWKVLIIISGF
jgi:hypothetical protein